MDPLSNLEPAAKPNRTVADPPLHPACALWPELSGPDLLALSNDIAERGLLEPIVMTPAGEILDGRNRWFALKTTDVEIRTTVYEGDPWLYSISKNARRRHLKPEQIAMVVAKLATRTVGNPNFAIGSFEPIGLAEAVAVPDEKNLSIAQVAAAAGISETSVKSAKTVLKSGTEAEKKAIERGDKGALRKAAERIRRDSRTSAKPTEKPAEAPTPSSDLIETLAREIISKCADGKWRTADKIAATVHSSTNETRDVLRHLGEDVESHKGKNGIFNYRISSSVKVANSAHAIKTGEANVTGENWRDLLVAKDAEIENLKARLETRDAIIINLEADVAQLKKKLAATAPPPDKKPARNNAPASVDVDSVH